MTTEKYKYTVLVISEQTIYGFYTASGVTQFCLTCKAGDLEIKKNDKVVPIPDGGITAENLRTLLERQE